MCLSSSNTAFVILCIRYRHIESHYVYNTNQVVQVKVHVLNILSSISGFVSAIGLLIVGSFQVSIIMGGAMIYIILCSSVCVLD